MTPASHPLPEAALIKKLKKLRAEFAFGVDAETASIIGQAIDAIAAPPSPPPAGAEFKALEHYADVYCEGWCKEAPAHANFDDCGGCKARLALYHSRIATPVQPPAAEPKPARYWEMMYTDLLKRVDAGEFSKPAAEQVTAEPVDVKELADVAESVLLPEIERLSNQLDKKTKALEALDVLLDFSDEPVDSVWTFECTDSIQAAFKLAHAALTDEIHSGEKS